MRVLHYLYPVMLMALILNVILWSGGGGGNVSLPVHLNPGFRSILVDSGLFTLFGLQNIRKGWVIFSFSPASRHSRSARESCYQRPLLFQPPIHFPPPFHPGSPLPSPRSPPPPPTTTTELWSLFAWRSAPGEFFSGQSKLKETSIQWFWTPQVSFTIQDSHFIICHLIWIT